MEPQARIRAIAAAGALLVSMMAAPSQAATPTAATCVGVMQFSHGLYYPVIGPEQSFSWDLQTTCTIVRAHGFETLGLNLSGTANGWCGRWVSNDGWGTLGSIAMTNIHWDDTGSLLTSSGHHDGGGLGTFFGEGTAPQLLAGYCAGGGSLEYPVVLQFEFA